MPEVAWFFKPLMLQTTREVVFDGLRIMLRVRYFIWVLNASDAHCLVETRVRWRKPVRWRVRYIQNWTNWSNASKKQTIFKHISLHWLLFVGCCAERCTLQNLLTNKQKKGKTTGEVWGCCVERCRKVHVTKYSSKQTNRGQQTNNPKANTLVMCGVLCRKVHVIRTANRQTRAGQTNKTE